MEFDLEKAQKTVGVIFRDGSLLETAFTHRSFLNENKHLRKPHNERLEFLGDAVLELVITDFLFVKYPKKNEGDLTLYRSSLVNTDSLAQTAHELEINDLLQLSHGESKDTGRGRHSILADAVEAIIGAIYMDQGYDVAKDFILKHIAPRIDEIIEKKAWIDAKSLFQEKAQEVYGDTPHYDTIDEKGPDHDKVFHVALFVGDKKIAVASGKSKQEAAQEAAAKGLEVENWR